VLALGLDNATSHPEYKGVSLLRLIFTGKRLSGEAVNAVDGSVFDRFAIDKSGAQKVWSGF
jgi:hypothetical protein